ncbi:MAG: glycosyl transferase family 1, partial [Vulcanococcus sp.]
MGLHLLHLHLHGLFRGHDLELGRDADTGGQTTYVLELIRSLAARPEVERVEVVTRLIEDRRVSPDYAVPHEPLGDGAAIVRLPFGPRRYLRKELLWPHLDALADALT